MHPFPYLLMLDDIYPLIAGSAKHLKRSLADPAKRLSYIDPPGSGDW